MYLLLQLGLRGTETKLLEVQLTLLKESSHIWHQRESSRRVTSRSLMRSILSGVMS